MSTGEVTRADRNKGLVLKGFQDGEGLGELLRGGGHEHF